MYCEYWKGFVYNYLKIFIDKLQLLTAKEQQLILACVCVCAQKKTNSARLRVCVRPSMTPSRSFDSGIEIANSNSNNNKMSDHASAAVAVAIARCLRNQNKFQLDNFRLFDWLSTSTSTPPSHSLACALRNCDFARRMLFMLLLLHIVIDVVIVIITVYYTRICKCTHRHIQQLTVLLLSVPLSLALANSFVASD